MVVAPTVPPEIFAVPEDPTVKLPSVRLESRVPMVTLARPSTWPPETFEVPAVTVRLVRLPPVTFSVPEVEVAPRIPAEMLAVPATPTVKLVRLAALISVPAVTLADAAEPDVMLVVPFVTLTEPAETVTFDRSMAVVSEPADETFPVRLPPVRLAVPLAPMVRSFRFALAVKVPAVTLERPVTVADVSLVMLLEAIEENVPPVASRLPALVVAPIVPAEILAVPAAPTFRLVRLAALTNVPPVTLADAPEPEEMLVVPAVVLTDPPDTLTLNRSMAVISVPAEETAPV